MLCDIGDGCMSCSSFHMSPVRQNAHPGVAFVGSVLHISAISTICWRNHEANVRDRALQFTTVKTIFPKKFVH